MNVQTERRAPFNSRIPFDTMVEVGGALGPTFEAKALDVSLAGMRLRTAYLPEVGQPVSCRFELGATTIVCEGDVIWSREAAKGGEFGIAFTALDAASEQALRHALEEQLGAVPGERLRLHVEGLAQPLKARVSDARPRMITAKTDLAFLKIGNHCDVERVDEGRNANARVGNVTVTIDPQTNIPQLIVSLRTAETPATSDVANDAVSQELAPEATPAEELLAAGPKTVASSAGHSVEDVGEATPVEPMEEAYAASTEEELAANSEVPARAASVRPVFDPPTEPGDEVVAGPSPFDRARSVFAPIALGAKEKVLLAWSKVQSLKSVRGTDGAIVFDNAEDAPKRVTAKAPGGGLHAKGRKIIREDRVEEAPAEVTANTRIPATPVAKVGAFAQEHKRKFALGGAIGIAALLAGVAFSKPAPQAPLATATPSTSTVEVAAAPAASAPAPMAPSPTPATVAANGVVPAPIPPAEPVLVDDGFEASNPAKKIGKVAPFSNGKVAHGKTLRLKMNAPIEKIQGARTPTGFTVGLPGVKALEAAAPLAKSDKRLAGVHVANGGERSELTVDFKDGVPNYLVRAKGDVLEIVLAEPTEDEVATASKPKAAAHAPKIEKVSTKAHPKKKH